MSAAEGAAYTWSGVLAAAMSGESASPEGLTWAMDQILEDAATPAQLAALITALRVRGETPDQLRAMLDSLLGHASLVDPATRPAVVIDVVGTGGDGSNSVNISTMAALVVAACGAPVIKHGNRAASSAAGSADVLESLGVALEVSPEAVAACASEVGIGFCFAPAFHPALRFAGPTRRELKVPTVFNILGPLANPAQPEAMLVGCSRLESAPTMAEVLHARGVRAIVVRGDDGLDEISTSCPTRVWDATGDAVVEATIDPEQWGITRVAADALVGASAEDNAAVLAAVLDPSQADRITADRWQAISDAVAVNAAAALVAYDAATGSTVNTPVGERIAAALPRAREVLESGAAWDRAQRWVEVSKSYTA